MLFYLPKAALLAPHVDRYAVWVFWACVAVIAYTYAGYPLLLWMLTKIRRCRSSEPSTAPSITILICAHNEARNIGKKLADCLALALAILENGTVLTSDHHELDPIAQAAICPIRFIR